MRSVLIVGDHLSGRGGMETIVFKVAKHLNDLNEFAGFYFDPRSQDGVISSDWVQGLHVIPSGNKTAKVFRSFAFVYRLRKFLKQEQSIKKIVRITPVYCHLLAKACKDLDQRIEIISWIHFSIDTFRDREKHYLVESCSKHLAISSGIKKRLVELGVPENRCITIYNCTVSHTETLSGLNREPFTILYVGRVEFNGAKNLQVLFETLKNFNQNWHLHIVGTGTPVDEKKCRELCQNLGIAKKISWHGWQSSPWAYVRKMIGAVNCLVLCSRYEGFPMVLVEALSYGIPCISSDCPTGPSDIIEKGENGLLYDCGDKTGLLTCLEKMYKQGVALRDEGIKGSIKKFYEESYFKLIDGVLLESER